MSRTTQEDAFDRAQLLPTKDTLTALKADVSLESAILELCDNALDAWEFSSNREEPITISIDVEENEGTELVIRDNAGGIQRDDASMLFGLGQTAKRDIDGSIGTFGVGAKKSLVNLGVPFTVSSRAESEDTGWTYQITEDWFEDDQNWTVPVHEDSEISAGETEIRIEDLNYEWTEETAQGLRDRLGEAYNLFLSDEMQQLHGSKYDLTILLEDEPVEAEGIPNWAYSPFDGLYPRRYENIELTSPEFEEPVSLHITVGLLTKKDNQKAGTDIYCQKRKVASCLRDDAGGFGTGEDRLGNFNPRHQRLKVIVELETEGDGQMLPWDTQKSSIDKHNPLMRGTDGCRGVYNWLRRTVQTHFDLDADRVPQAFLEPYDAEHPAAVNGGRPKRLDYSDRSRITTTHKPDSDLSDVDSIRKKAQCHAELWISCENEISDSKVEAYRTQLDRESDRNLENLRQVEGAPPESIEKEPHRAAGRLSTLARKHYENGIYCTSYLNEWELARYEGFMDRHDQQRVNAREDVPADVPRSTEDLVDQNGELVETDGKGPAIYTQQKLEDDSKKTEQAELFLVFGAKSDDERGGRVIDASRKQLCKSFGLETDASEEALWEEMRRHFENIID